MRRLSLLFLIVAAAFRTAAQQFIVFDTSDGRTVVDASDVESITLERDDLFYGRLLPEAIVSDPSTSLFGQALMRTGLADSLRAYVDESYPIMSDEERTRHLFVGAVTEWLRVPEVRRRSFTAFVETDAVFAAHGIHTLTDLEAFTRKVYDEAFPEDVSVSNPTDRRHPLNRFVAYHLLPFGSSYDELTPNPILFYRNLTDACDWYQTLLPCASLKCARPRTDDCVYLNRRGINDGPDRYGVQVRGARIVPGADGELTQQVSNGAYYYIDDVLTYDLQTQQVALNERWRISATSLSPDFMTMGIRAVNEESVRSVPTCVFLNGKADNLHFAESTETYIVYPHRMYWQWDAQAGFAVGSDRLEGACDLTLALPALPEGEYELRFGNTSLPTQPRVRFSLDNTVLAEGIDFLNWNDMRFAERTGWQPYTTDSAEVCVRREMSLRGWMPGPMERAVPLETFGDTSIEPTSDNSRSMRDAARMNRAIVGRFHSDGRHAPILRIESIPYSAKEYKEITGSKNYDGLDPDAPVSRPVMLDYIEICPVWIADNEEFPEI